ncbi:hypothetical protein H9L39_13137 [Fusarium oxysporum f. sp. albedinis]|nr:hypothetical protein H9L39_13137 [Fusarium oxysporum f. sp. albedinis]
MVEQHVRDSSIHHYEKILRLQAIESLKVTRNVGVTTLNRQAKILEIEARKHSASTIVVKTISSASTQLATVPYGRNNSATKGNGGCHESCKIK